jgi:hypothetical protein
MTQYDLKVNKSTKTAKGSRLRELSSVRAGGPTLGLITTLATNDPPKPGSGDESENAATIYLKQTKIDAIHRNVNDNGAAAYVTIHFALNAGVVSGFTDSYST